MNNIIDYKFEDVQWNTCPPEVSKLKNGQILVTRNVHKQTFHDVEDDVDIIRYCGLRAIMTDAMFGAYIGTKEVAIRRENDIIDDYTQELIEGGLI